MARPKRKEEKSKSVSFSLTETEKIEFKKDAKSFKSVSSFIRYLWKCWQADRKKM